MHHYFEDASDEVIGYVLHNVEDTKKIHFLTQKCVYYSYILKKIYQYSFPENSVHSSKLLELIHSDLLELSTLSYSKYKWAIIFLDNYSFYSNITFLHKKSEAIEVIKSILQIWSNTTSHHIKRLHTDNREEYVISELQFFLREQEIIHKISTLYVYQQNYHAE